MHMVCVGYFVTNAALKLKYYNKGISVTKSFKLRLGSRFSNVCVDYTVLKQTAKSKARPKLHLLFCLIFSYLSGTLAKLDMIRT